MLPGEHGDIWIWWGNWEPGDVFDALILRCPVAHPLGAHRPRVTAR